MKHKKQIRSFFLALWVGIGAALVFGIAFKNLPLDGKLSAAAQPGIPSAFFGGFRPEQRVTVTPEHVAVLEAEPIYFAMAAPPFFRTATVRIEYLNEGQPTVALGGRASLEEWAFDIKPLKTVATEGEWQTGEAAFELGSLAADVHGEVQMVVSMPAMQKGNASPVQVRRIDILYEREPLTVASVIEAVKKRL